MIKHNYEMDGHVRAFVELVERQMGDKMKHRRSDNGGEYGFKTLNDYLDHRGNEPERNTHQTENISGNLEIPLPL